MQCKRCGGRVNTASVIRRYHVIRRYSCPHCFFEGVDYLSLRVYNNWKKFESGVYPKQLDLFDLEES